MSLAESGSPRKETPETVTPKTIGPITELDVLAELHGPKQPETNSPIQRLGTELHETINDEPGLPQSRLRRSTAISGTAIVY
jgi:hypothetical protein